jgi:RNA polymerase sigma-70 factor (ECF subfamily)
MTDKKYVDIIEENKHSIYRVCKLYATEIFESEDLFQEVVYQIWKSFPSFKGTSKVSTWIYRIALNVCYKSILKHKKASDKITSLDAVKVEEIAASNSHDENSRYEALQACINQLSKADQAVIVLFLEELSYREISETIGISENYVAVKMKRIREILHACLTLKLQ